jgi:hypothetical protein
LNASEIRNTNISLTVDQVKDQKQPLALRLCGQLLLGLARIYEMKVKQTSEEAEGVLKKIHALIGESAKSRPSRKSRILGDEDEESIHPERVTADPKSIRATGRAITAQIMDDFSRFGHELIDVDIENLLDNPEGLYGKQLGEDDELNLPAPHATIDLENGKIQFGELTQSTPLGTYPASVAEPEDVGLGELDLDAEPLFIDEAEEARDKPHGDDISVHGGLDQSSVHQKVDDVDMDLGGGSGFIIDEDNRSVAPRSVAASEIDVQIDAVSKQIEISKRKLKEQKKEKDQRRESKRQRNATYQPVLDEVTELSGATLKGWLADDSDIVLRERPAAHLQRSSYAASQIALWKSSMESSLRLPGLRYHTAIIDANEVEPIAPIQPESLHGLDEIGVEPIEFPIDMGPDGIDLGGQGGMDFEPSAIDIHGEEVELDKMAIDDLDHYTGYDGPVDGSQSTNPDLTRFFGDESKRKSTKGGVSRDLHESGWSHRTKQFHSILANQFKKHEVVSLDNLLETHARGPRKEVRHVTTVAAAFYQTLVLASRGFIVPKQEDGLDYGEITMTKTKRFDNKKEMPASESSASEQENQLTQSSATY